VHGPWRMNLQAHVDLGQDTLDASDFARLGGRLNKSDQSPSSDSQVWYKFLKGPCHS